MNADVVELIGNPRLGSRTRTLADGVTETLVSGLAARGISLPVVSTLELSEVVAVSFSPERPARASGHVADPFGLVRAARILVVATPTYKGSYTGLLKIFLDQYQSGDLAGTVAVGVAIAASDGHLRHVTTALDALLVAVGAQVPAPALGLLESQLVDADAAITAWADQHVTAVAAVLNHPGPAE